MREKLVLLLLLLCPVAVLGGRPKHNPADYTITVHVIGSQNPPNSGGVQRIHAVIDGQPVELFALSQGLLALGDYPAKLTASATAPHNHAAYDTFRAYEFLLPDGNTRYYEVIAIGVDARRTKAEQRVHWVLDARCTIQ